MIVFDIETGPLPPEELAAKVPAFDELAAVPDVAPFDPASVAIGALKDPVKIAAKFAAAKTRQAELVASLVDRRAAARAKHVAQYTEKAALSALTGQVKAIGLKHDNGQHTILFPDGSPQRSESHIIATFWLAWMSSPTDRFVGHNIFGFDLPFLMRRSRLLGVDVPDGIRQVNNRCWSNQFIDLMERWGCGSSEYVKLEAIDQALGGEGKPDDCTGADFARMFDAGGEEREAALRYLQNDLDMTWRVAWRMCVL